ncbi:MAG: tRNA epoxyqueuosine(34) reductase QueG [Candidatus Omnitrophica bacterium]|nr:tRNA epoxyqueuosine(34) reductase QueG [Candidatus Omnitrophota bacterium]
MISLDQIKSLARSLGFDVCGITGAGPLPEAEEALRLWVKEGRHGGMKYLEDFEFRAKRFWESFPEAKSIIVVGVNYYSENAGAASGSTSRKARRGLPRPDERRGNLAPTDGNDASTGRIARYAWGKDYHQVIRSRLKEFQQKLEQLAGRPTKVEICVDTKPLLERPLAQKAGLGFIGKQSQLLSPEFGPWLFLAELVTDLELAPDIPFIGSCGTCRICIDECPTEAILPEGGIDARRCISYLTIEHKGEIPEALRPLIGDWVFGCDICLEVCPFTSKAKETKWPEFRPESGFGRRLDLVKLLEIPSNRAYEREFEGSALPRANRKQMRRNAATVLKNLGSLTRPHGTASGVKRRPQSLINGRGVRRGGGGRRRGSFQFSRQNPAGREPFFLPGSRPF